VFWSIIKDDLVSLFQDFHRGDLPLYSLNFFIIILLPKSKALKQFNNLDLFVYSM
jgi:hypothetical protein